MRRALLLPLGLALAAGDVAAQIATDGTVGPRVELAGPEFAIGADLGTRAGDNLFHSFERFSLATGEGATFTGPNDLRNVISRVTGGERSDIDGALRSAIAGADFYFINPAGVLFGPNASIDVPGAFHVSTGDELRFADGEVFSARDPSASSFSFAAPEAFGFLGSDAGEIRVAGSQLALFDAGQTLSLTGGNLVVANGSVIGVPNLLFAAQASAGEVPVTPAGSAAIRSGTITFGSEAAEPPAFIVSAGLVSGNFRIEAGELRIVNAVVGDVHESPIDSTGGLDVAAERVIIRNDNPPPGVTNGLITFSQGAGRAGDLRIVASEVTVIGGVIGSVPQVGDGGRVTVEADRILLAGGATTEGGIGAPSGIPGSLGGASGGIAITAHESLTIGTGGTINAESFGNRAGGSIAINLDRGAALSMQPGSLIEATANGSGQGGGIAISGGEVLITGGVVNAATFGAGNGGTIDIDTGEVLITAGVISAETFDAGSGGTIDIDAGQLVLNNGFVVATTRGPGQGGGIAITGDDVRITGGVVSAETFAGGDAGTIDIDTGRLLLDNSFLGANSRETATGNAGQVVVDADRIAIRNEGRIFNGTSSSGTGGDVTVTARSLLIDGALDHAAQFNTGISATAQTGSSGDSGRVEVSADGVIRIQNGGEIASGTRGDGQAGDVVVGARSITLLDGGQIDSSTEGSGDAGNLVITARDLTMNGGVVSAETFAGGRGGTIDIDTGQLFLNNSFVGANSNATATNDAGPVMIEADRLEIRNEGRIFNGTESGGRGGDVTVTAGTLLIDGALDHQARFNTGISAAAQPGSIGRSGQVAVSVDETIVLQNGGEIASGTQGDGPAGNVLVDARTITLRDGGQIDSSSTGGGNAGSLTIRADDQLVLDRGRISTSSQQSGGGRITIQVRELIDLQKSSIESSVAQEAGNAGDISIDPHFLVLDDSQILARAVAGRGGDISIVADNLVLSPDSLINAEAGEAGVDGTVATSEPAVDLASALVVLAAPLLDADSLLREPCAARQDVGTSSFTGAGRGGLPAAPDRPLGSAYGPAVDAEATSVRPAALTIALPCAGAD
jgi:filamentous hemagglutinin family protein